MKKRLSDKDKTLKQFLIQKFIIIMLVVAVSEWIINFLFSQWLQPLISKLLIFSDVTITKVPTGVLTGMIQVMIALIIICIMSLLPNYVADFLNTISQNFIVGVLQIKMETNLSVKLESPILEQLYYLGLIFLFILILIMIVLPYFIAAVFFSRMVSKKVEGPIQTLTVGMRQVSEGKLETRLVFDTEHEFIEMRNTFNEMASQMEESAKEKEKFEQRKNLLFSDIAHDLKTPITTISGYATALADGLITEKEKEKQYLEAIKVKSLHMDELIMLLFEYVKLDSEGFRLNKEELDLTELVRENIALLYTDFEMKKISVEMDIPDEVVIYQIDRVQFSRVITNLLQNAIRYNKEGCLVTIKMEVGDQIKIQVGDNGDPIKQEIAEHIFEPFVTGDESRNARGGSGLGLSIAKKVVTMHGGNLLLDNQHTSESTKIFLITLPLS